MSARRMGRHGSRSAIEVNTRPQSDGPYRERGADRRGNLGEFSKIQSNWAGALLNCIAAFEH